MTDSNNEIIDLEPMPDYPAEFSVGDNVRCLAPFDIQHPDVYQIITVWWKDNRYIYSVNVFGGENIADFSPQFLEKVTE